jgi:Co/Zn/Cd efflux system component
MGDLAGFASAITLALIALLIAWERLLRPQSPVAIYDCGRVPPVSVSTSLASGLSRTITNITTITAITELGKDRSSDH